MNETVVRIIDFERRSREPDAVPVRDPSEATIIVLPTVRVERYLDHHELVDYSHVLKT